MLACSCSVDRKTDVAVIESLQVVDAASQTDQVVTVRGAVFFVRLGQMIYHFLAYAVDIECSNVTEELLLKDILSLDERQKIMELKRPGAKVKSLLMTMREKSASQFEGFLTTLSETGQQSVADVVRLVLCRVGQTEYNPLRYAPGTTEENVFRGMQQWPIAGNETIAVW